MYRSSYISDMNPSLDMHYYCFLLGCGLSFDVTSSPALPLTSSVPFTLPLSYPLAFLLVLPHAKHDLIFAPPCSPFFLSKMPPDPRYLDYVLPYFIWVSAQMVSSQRTFSNHHIQNSFPKPLTLFYFSS